MRRYTLLLLSPVRRIPLIPQVIVRPHCILHVRKPHRRWDSETPSRARSLHPSLSPQYFHPLVKRRKTASETSTASRTYVYLALPFKATARKRHVGSSSSRSDGRTRERRLFRRQESLSQEWTFPTTKVGWCPPTESRRGGLSATLPLQKAAGDRGCRRRRRLDAGQSRAEQRPSTESATLPAASSKLHTSRGKQSRRMDCRFVRQALSLSLDGRSVGRPSEGRPAHQKPAFV